MAMEFDTFDACLAELFTCLNTEYRTFFSGFAIVAIGWALVALGTAIRKIWDWNDIRGIVLTEDQRAAVQVGLVHLERSLLRRFDKLEDRVSALEDLRARKPGSPSGFQEARSPYFTRPSNGGLSQLTGGPPARSSVVKELLTNARLRPERDRDIDLDTPDNQNERDLDLLRARLKAARRDSFRWVSIAVFSVFLALVLVILAIA